MRWCVAAQYALLDIQWPEALLKLPDCAPETDLSTGRLSFRGLRIRMGASFGSGLIRKPLNTGPTQFAQPLRPFTSACAPTTLHRILQ